MSHLRAWPSPGSGKYDLVDAPHLPASFLGLLTGVLGAGSILVGLVSGSLLRHIGEHRLVLLNGVAGTVPRMIPAVPTALLGGSPPGGQIASRVAPRLRVSVEKVWALN